MWKNALLASVAVFVVVAGVIGSVVGVAAILGQVAVLVSMGVTLLTIALVVAYGWSGPSRTGTPYW